MPVFARSVVIQAPADVVFAFHEREDALALLSPAFPPVRVLSREGGIRKGACVVLRVGVLRWVAVHTDYKKNRYFQDEQAEGPFKKWKHRHEFEPEGAGTRLTDRIEYELPGGRLVNWLLRWPVSVGLGNMFRHRHRVTKSMCERG